MTVLETLRSNNERLSNLYAEHLDTVRSIRRTFLDEILPDLADSLGLDAKAEREIRCWMDDLASIFRVLKRHNFVAAFALDSLQASVQWRIRELSGPQEDRCSFLYCLPHVRDPFDRPIVVLRLGAPSMTVSGFKQAATQTMEYVRSQIMDFNRAAHSEDGPVGPLLQYVMLLDVADLNLPYNDLREMSSWYMYELLPRFPGMLAAVFIVNFSWTYSGAWSVIKHALPASALSRVFFPSAEELLEYFSPTALPQELGGSLPPTAQLEDLSPGHRSSSAQSDLADASARSASPLQPTRTTPALSRSSGAGVALPLPATSFLNPFYGYPASYTTASGTIALALRHGRRRKRDLVLTLARLFWGRWRLHLYASMLLLAAAVIVGQTRRRRWRAALAALCAGWARWAAYPEHRAICLAAGEFWTIGGRGISLAR